MSSRVGDVWAVIPALDEEETIAGVVRGTLSHVHHCLVVDNGSGDRTAEAARMAGAVVVREDRRGYGAACQRGVRFLRGRRPWAVVFLAGDGSDDPGELPKVLGPVLRGECHLVLGSRSTRRHQPLVQRWGNRFITWAVNRFVGTAFSDIGPMRAILWEALLALELQDRGFAWTLEMQLKACKGGLRIGEVPVNHRPRQGGRQKISGTFLGTWRAGRDLMACLGREILGA